MGDLTFPLRLWRDENPDYIVQAGANTKGIEVTEAVDREEQIVWTRTAKADEECEAPSLHVVDQGSVDAHFYARLAGAAVEAKTKRCSVSCTELVVYLNTSHAMFDAPSVRQLKLAEALRGQQRFDCVWIISGGSLFSFPKALPGSPDLNGSGRWNVSIEE